ncbi:MAG: hypothetical protein K2Q18_18605 [Bdellovibrionales bacterium]|nr:hypothetical protein [Bdellovibrionales bacterium]
MKISLTKNIIIFIVTAVILLNPMHVMAQDATSSGILDESLEDLTIVLSTGAVGAVLGLSTLSFAETPKDHLKNVAIGGALGIVVGVGIAVFGQATKSQSVIAQQAPLMDANAVESLARADFSKQKIAQNYLLPETVGYNFSF